jgi:hypothetical protein
MESLEPRGDPSGQIPIGVQVVDATLRFTLQKTRWKKNFFCPEE